MADKETIETGTDTVSANDVKVDAGTSTKSEKPKSLKQRRYEKYQNEFSQYADVKEASVLAGDEEFNDLAGKATAFALFQLSIGENPSAKFLEQKVEAKPDAEMYRRFLSTICPTMSFVPVGQGAEFILTNCGVVNAFNQDAFIPEFRNDLGNYTYVDNIVLPLIEDTLNGMKKTELSIAYWKYLPYSLSGKFDEVAAQIKPYLEEAMLRKQAIDLARVCNDVFKYTQAKAESTENAPTNHFKSTATAHIDAWTDFQNFAFPMTCDNTQYNYGSVNAAGTYSEYTAAFNSTPASKQRYIADYRTYNASKASTLTYFNLDKVSEWSNLDKWFIIPASIYNTDKTAAGSTPVDKGVIELFKILYDTNGQRVKGAILCISTELIKGVYNYDTYASADYVPNQTQQMYHFKNYAYKALKFGQCFVFEAPVLEQPMAVQTNTRTNSNKGE